MTGNPLGVAIVGCGDISRLYLATMPPHSATLALVGAFDRDRERTRALAAEAGCAAYRTMAEVLADERVEIVVNLTPPAAHADVTAAALESGRHVYSEKPLALEPEDAHALVALADRRGCRLAAAPCTFMGEAQQTLLALVRSGRLGRIGIAYAEANQGRIEHWHPAPRAFYAIGALRDVGVYPLALLTVAFGPVRSVQAAAITIRSEIRALDGSLAPVTAPEFVVALLMLESGTAVRLTTTFYVGKQSRQRGIELHGDAGSASLASWQAFDAEVEVGGAGGADRQPLEPVAPAYRGTEWVRGLVELADAIRADRPHRGDGAHAAHLVDVVDAIERSAVHGAPVPVGSSFPAAAPMPWAAAATFDPVGVARQEGST